jgi:hypothetical protein
MNEPDFETALDSVVSNLLAQAAIDNRASPAWKDLWTASEQGLSSLLSEAESQTKSILIKVCDVIKDRFGIPSVSPRLFKLIKALPFAMWEVREYISEEQGHSCCADKARQVYYEKVLEEIKLIQKNGLYWVKKDEYQ